MSKDENSILNNKEETKKTLDKFLKDKTVARESEFTDKGQKTEGVTTGYVAANKDSGHNFMMKHAHKTQELADAADKSVNALKKEKVEEQGYTLSDRFLSFQHRNDRKDLLAEYLTAPLYERVLYDRAPKIELTVKQDSELVEKGKSGVVQLKGKADEASLNIRSKFLNNFETIEQFKKLREGETEEARNNRIKKITGFEKVIAASLLVGEVDYHDQNLGIVTTGKAGAEEYVVNKIDHGRSRATPFANEAAMRAELYSKLVIFEYRPNDESESIGLNVDKLKSSVDDMTKTLSPDEVKALVGARILKLKEAGFDPVGVEFDSTQPGAPSTIIKAQLLDPKGEPIPPSPYQQVEEHLTKNIEAQRKIMQDFSKTLEAVQAIGEDKEWRNGQWLDNIKGNDPIVTLVTTPQLLQSRSLTDLNNVAAYINKPENSKYLTPDPKTGKSPLDIIKEQLPRAQAQEWIANPRALERANLQQLNEVIDKIKENPTLPPKSLAIIEGQRARVQAAEWIAAPTSLKNASLTELTNVMVHLKENPRPTKLEIMTMNTIEAQRLNVGANKIGENSSLYKILMGSDEKAQAILINEMAKIPSAVGSPTISTTQAILENTPAALWDKMGQMADKAKEHQGNNIRDKITLFGNKAKLIIGKGGVNNEEIAAALKELRGLKSSSTGLEKTAESQAAKNVSKFADILKGTEVVKKLGYNAHPTPSKNPIKRLVSKLKKDKGMAK